MNIALWIITGALALAYGTGGASQILLSKARYRALAPSQHWVDDFSAGKIKAIGTIKLVGVAGLILPPLVGIMPELSPIAACGLALLMSGAATTRFRRSEWAYMAGDTAYMLAFIFVAWGRFALAPYGS
ncbi:MULTISPECIES: DoxX family protein [unclassified Microbacterium]|uniref:DoxX family protein n=1 Tax=unclassified Microbacterium TaxID=2609290 RepID=UPI0012FA9D8F|nr:DoxX family protein [Microbacterium sp. MAH-37]MVQ42808.1 DoxX family protein [Microbacterium sp. MAH-37]